MEIMNDNFLTEWMLGGKTPSNYFLYNTFDINGINKFVHYLHSIQSIEGYGVVFCFLNKNLYLGERIKLSGMIRTKSIQEYADLWIRGEKPNDLWEMKSLECDSIKEKDSWKEYSIIVDIPIDVKRLSVGLTLKGEGHIWFHSMKVEIIKEK